ncbi:MAG TPA: hypothetical protein VFC50_00090 [Candidatus Dormibacteraeota bacterium]|nr:hypothetical protein [Candidatus Dormibacteraeota bacterium]
MTKIKKPAGGKAIIDVAHPGKSAPSANSKSVIIGHRPLLKDPMMVDETASQSGNSADSSLASVSNKSGAQPLTAPLLDHDNKAETDTSPEDSASAAEPTETASPEPTAEDKTGADDPSELSDSISPDQPPESPAATESVETPEEPVDNDAAPAPDDNGSVDDQPKADKPEPETPAKPDQAPSDATEETEPKPAEADTGEATPQSKEKAKQAEVETNQEAQRQATIDKLADSKKYYLPINAVEKRRSRRFVILGIILSLLLIVAWADIALDAGLIHVNGIKPVTHFFSN